LELDLKGSFMGPGMTYVTTFQERRKE
jgi:hypothetical protein